MPGTLTDIRFTVREWVMMTPPYGRCRHEAPSSISFSDQVYSYSERACQQGVVQEMISQRCGCLSYDMPIPSELQRNMTNEGLPFCQYFELPVVNISARRATDIKAMYFTEEAMEEFVKRMTCSTSLMRNTVAAETGCLVPCQRYSYDTQISSAQWPTKRFITNFATRVSIRKLPCLLGSIHAMRGLDFCQARHSLLCGVPVSLRFNARLTWTSKARSTTFS